MWTANGDWLTSGPIWLRDGHSFSPLSVKQWPRQSLSTFQVNLQLNSFRAFKYNAVQQGKDCGEWRLRTVKRSFVRVKHRPTSSTVSRNYIYIFSLRPQLCFVPHLLLLDIFLRLKSPRWGNCCRAPCYYDFILTARVLLRWFFFPPQFQSLQGTLQIVR